MFRVRIPKIVVLCILDLNSNPLAIQSLQLILFYRRHLLLIYDCHPRPSCTTTLGPPPPHATTSLVVRSTSNLVIAVRVRLNKLCPMGYRRLSPSSIPCWILLLADNSNVNAYLGFQLGMLHVVLVFARWMWLVRRIVFPVCIFVSLARWILSMASICCSRLMVPWSSSTTSHPILFQCVRCVLGTSHGIGSCCIFNAQSLSLQMSGGQCSDGAIVEDMHWRWIMLVF